MTNPTQLDGRNMGERRGTRDEPVAPTQTLSSEALEAANEVVNAWEVSSASPDRRCVNAIEKLRVALESNGRGSLGMRDEPAAPTQTSSDTAALRATIASMNAALDDLRGQLAEERQTAEQWRRRAVMLEERVERIRLATEGRT